MIRNRLNSLPPPLLGRLFKRYPDPGTAVSWKRINHFNQPQFYFPKVLQIRMDERIQKLCSTLRLKLIFQDAISGAFIHRF